MRQKNQILYQKVFDVLKADLISGKYEVGSLFPTENELEIQFNVSKITVRKAVDLLVEGVISINKVELGLKSSVISLSMFSIKLKPLQKF